MTKSKKQRLLGLSLLVLLPGILIYQQQKGGSGTYRGRYTDFFETSRFEPCGTNEKWWATGQLGPIYQQFYPNFKTKGLPESSGQSGYVEVQGTTTWRGSYGHMGGYDREIEVEKVLKVQIPVPDSCH